MCHTLVTTLLICELYTTEFTLFSDLLVYIDILVPYTLPNFHNKLNVVLLST